MANLTVTVAVTTGTQYVTGSTSSIYTFDGSQPASFTFPWVASGTVRLDQSGASNDGHPLIFSTSNSTTLGTMQAGIISSGVTYYLDGSSNQSDYTNTTTFNAATTRYIEIAPASQTDFYFACWVHGIGMGGIMDMTQDTWGALSWSENDWGDQDAFTVHLTGVSATPSLGDLAYAGNIAGWGRNAWGDNDWGENTTTVFPTGLSLSTSLGTILAYPELGWGRDPWGFENWGENVTTVFPTGLGLTATLGDLAYAAANDGWGRSSWGKESWGVEAIHVPLTGLEITASLGDLSYAGATDGWGRNTWGDNDWGQNATTISLTGVSASTTVGNQAWGQGSWGNSGWGDYVLEVADVMGLTGVSATGTVGSPVIIGDYTASLTGQAIASAVGAIIPEIGVPLTGLSGAISVGSPTARGDYTASLSGLELEIDVGAPAVTTNPVVQPVGLSVTSTVGAITPPGQTMGLTGVSATSAVGAIAPTEQTMGLTGVSATVTLSPSGVAPIGWGRVTAAQTGNYSKVTATQTGNWTRNTK